MTTLTNLLITLFVAIVTGIATVLSAKIAGKAQKNSKQIEVSGPEWKSFVEEVNKQNDKLIENIQQQVTLLQDELSEVKLRCSTLEKEYDILTEKYRLAIRYGKEWRTKHPKLIKDIYTPKEIEEDLQ